MQVLSDLQVAVGPLLRDPRIQAMYQIGIIRLQAEDAAALWLLTGMSREQWTALAAALNCHLDKADKHRDGGILPSVTTMHKRLKKNGDFLARDCYEVFAVQDAGTVYVVDDDGAVAEEQPDGSGQHRAFGTGARCMGVLVPDLENTFLVPEMQLIQHWCPQAWRKMCAAGMVHICIQADNCSVVNFGGFAQKLEQGILRVLLPLKDQPQQSPAHNLHFLLYEGGETYETLEKVFQRMLQQGRFPRKISVPASEDEPGRELEVVWHVCSDHLLMSLLSGMGGAGCTKPCFLCDWSRDHPDGLRQQCQPRTLESMRLQAQWREHCVQPFLAAEQQKSAAKKALEAARRSGDQDRVKVVSLLLATTSCLQVPFCACAPLDELPTGVAFDICQAVQLVLCTLSLNGAGCGRRPQHSWRG